MITVCHFWSSHVNIRDKHWSDAIHAINERFLTFTFKIVSALNTMRLHVNGELSCTNAKPGLAMPTDRFHPGWRAGKMKGVHEKLRSRRLQLASGKEIIPEQRERWEKVSNETPSRNYKYHTNRTYVTIDGYGGASLNPKPRTTHLRAHDALRKWLIYVGSLKCDGKFILCESFFAASYPRLWKRRKDSLWDCVEENVFSRLIKIAKVN